MELGQVSRPREALEEYRDDEPRTKCTTCCGLRMALLVGAGAFVLSAPLITLRYGMKKVRSFRLRDVLDAYLLVPLPLAAIVFTHHAILSESLWSKHKKIIFDCQVEATVMNCCLWILVTAVGTAVSRKVLPARFRWYRLLNWEYERIRRTCSHRWLPTFLGRVSEDLDWYNIVWTLTAYHLVWGTMILVNEKQQGAHYAMFYREMPYSKWCSPRWREWREHKVRELVDTQHRVAKNRWGISFRDRWGISDV